MIWYKKLYLGESIKQARWVKYKISYGKKTKGYYCITLSEHGKNLLDIYPSRLLCCDGFQSDDLCIIGVASDKKEAFDVVRDIIEDVYVHTRNFDIKGYLGIRI